MSIFEIPIPVDRTSALWLRLRSASQHAAWYVDLDDHCDRVYRTLCERVGRYPATTGPGDASPEEQAAGARQETP